MKLSGILVEGIDARKFLQGQLTCDLQLLKLDHPLRGAHCNQKGRVEALYDIFLKEDNILLITPAEVIDHALEKLAFYARFSKVKLSKISIDDKIKVQMPRLYPQTTGKYLPQELGLDRTEALSLTKGCYLGQEIVARLHHLGKLKREMVSVPFDFKAQPGEILNHPTLGEIELIDHDNQEALILSQLKA